MNDSMKCPKCGYNFSDRYTCTRCKHTWKPRNDKPPEVCPKCKSPYWSKPRIKKVGKKNEKK